MLSSNAVASKQTARALEIRYGRDFMGRTFCVGETIEVNGVEVRTCPTRHAIGASAFRWENESGTSILVTGDVKDYRGLPKADVLIAEANYGDPWDLSCIFDDDLASFWDAMQDRSAFGAYAFGKAQRAVGLLRGMGYSGPIGMDEESIVLTSELMPECGPLVSYGEEADISVVTPFNLGKARQSQKYFLTGRQGNSFSTIRISDHLDFRGIMKMVEHVHPESLIAYHPCGTRTRLFAHHLRQIGMDAISVDEVDNFIK
jgi:putative mRNA 3-end processing factor